MGTVHNFCRRFAIAKGFTIVGSKLENTMVVRLMISMTTFVAAFVYAALASATVVSDWNAAALAEVRLSKSLRNGPPIVARALAIAHTCMYDAWAAYDDIAVGTTDTAVWIRPDGTPV